MLLLYHTISISNKIQCVLGRLHLGLETKEAKNKESLKQERDTKSENNVLSRLNKSVVVISDNERKIDERRRLEVRRSEQEVRRNDI